MTYAGEILLLPLPTVLDTYFRFLTTPGVRRGEKTFSTPYRNCCPLSSAGTITGGTLFHGQGNRETGKQGTTTTQSPTRFSTAPLISTINWIHNPLSYCQTPRFHGSPAILFHKVKKAGGGVPHDRKAKDQVYSNVRPCPLPSRNFQEKSCIKSI